jgi:hypothetical protein
METEQLHQQRVSRTLDAQSANSGTAQFVDNRPKQNLTGLPDNLKSGIENLSGFSMDDVRVHYNSDKPAQLQALAYTQGTDIHVAPGQEKHLPHEAWHVVQQMQGRVRPTMQLKGVDVNDEEGLEREADRMGGEAVVQRVRTIIIEKELSKSAIEVDNRKRTIESNTLGKKARADLYYPDSNNPINTGTSNIGTNELLIIVSHGSLSISESLFAGNNAGNLAEIISKILPDNYSGQIYLDGCNTGLKPGMDGIFRSSYAEEFKEHLKTYFFTKYNKITNFTVKGNLGEAVTMIDEKSFNQQKKLVGTEWIIVNEQNRKAINERRKILNEQEGGKWEGRMPGKIYDKDDSNSNPIDTNHDYIDTTSNLQYRRGPDTKVIY